MLKRLPCHVAEAPSYVKLKFGPVCLSVCDNLINKPLGHVGSAKVVGFRLGAVREEHIVVCVVGSEEADVKSGVNMPCYQCCW